MASSSTAEPKWSMIDASFSIGRAPERISAVTAAISWARWPPVSSRATTPAFAGMPTG
jgi:hypothetical protein